MARRILVTSALPYANGALHLGHMVEYVQTDVWVRFQKMQGHQCYYICADDTHGTAVMLRAQQDNIPPERLIQQTWRAHKQDFDRFLIDFDYYGSTHSDENRAFSEEIFLALEAQGLIQRKPVVQPYDVQKGVFLPDRFVKGTCPRCAAPDQYGDNCEKCGAAYAVTELKDSYSVLSGTSPELRESRHYFFKLSDPRCALFLTQWCQETDRLQPEALNKLKEWLGETHAEMALVDWDISRDAPYFGFLIPGSQDQYFYVWLDAPVGYISAFKLFCQDSGVNFEHFWKPEAEQDTELYHFIGKDILYFHALFWPAMLNFSQYRTPDRIFAHGFLTVNGEKMSKSRGTFISVNQYLEAGLDPEWLRYYLACKLNSGMGDVDLNLEDFVGRVNSDLIGKYINIASRCARFLEKFFSNRLSKALSAQSLQVLEQARNVISETGVVTADRVQGVAQHYESRTYTQAMREISTIADIANHYIDQKKPWVLAKQPGYPELQEVCTVALNLFRLITVLLKPVLPRTAAAVEQFFQSPELCWQDAYENVLDQDIESYVHLMQRMQLAPLQALTKPQQA